MKKSNQVSIELSELRLGISKNFKHLILLDSLQAFQIVNDLIEQLLTFDRKGVEKLVKELPILLSSIVEFDEEVLELQNLELPSGAEPISQEEKESISLTLEKFLK